LDGAVRRVLAVSHGKSARDCPDRLPAILPPEQSFSECLNVADLVPAAALRACCGPARADRAWLLCPLAKVASAVVLQAAECSSGLQPKSILQRCPRTPLAGSGSFRSGRFDHIRVWRPCVPLDERPRKGERRFSGYNFL